MLPAMPDSRKHRGAAPEDAVAFGAEALPRLREAGVDFCWLLSRGYAHRSGIKIVGDRYALTERQRLAGCAGRVRMGNWRRGGRGRCRK